MNKDNQITASFVRSIGIRSSGRVPAIKSRNQFIIEEVEQGVSKGLINVVNEKNKRNSINSSNNLSV